MKLFPLPLNELLCQIEVQTEKTEACWIWKGAVNKKNDPFFPVLHKQKYWVDVKVRRVLWVSTYGTSSIPETIPMSCGVKKCIAPIHLQTSGERFA